MCRLKLLLKNAKFFLRHNFENKLLVYRFLVSNLKSVLWEQKGSEGGVQYTYAQYSFFLQTTVHQQTLR